MIEMSGGPGRGGPELRGTVLLHARRLVAGLLLGCLAAGPSSLEAQRTQGAGARRHEQSTPSPGPSGRAWPRLSLDGFGTVGASYSSEEHADYAVSPSRRDGPGYSNRVDAGLDTRLAGQAAMHVGSRLTALVQVLADEQGGEYGLNVEWANVTYAFTPDLRVRGGRIVMPSFLVSDARKLSYAYVWVRPPVDVYGLMPIYTLDGVDASYRTHVGGEWIATFAAAFGETEAAVRNGKAQGERIWSVNATAARDQLVARVGVAGARLSTDLMKPLMDGFRAFGPAGDSIADRYDVHDRKLRFATAGVEYDPGPWFGIVELGWTETRSAIGDRLGGHVTTGVRWRTLTPFAAYSRAAVLSETATPGLDVMGMPPQFAAAATQLNAALNRTLSSAPRQQTLAIGGRWDFMPNAAFKAQVEFVDMLDDSHGSFINLQPGFNRGGSARLFSVATAFVF